MFGFCEAFYWIWERIYLTWDRNFFNLAVIIVAVFSKIEFILFLRFASKEPMKNFRITGGLKYFLPLCDIMGHPI